MSAIKTPSGAILVNPSDRCWTRSLFVLWFGACGVTYVGAYANSLDDALDEAVDYLAAHAPGLLANEQYEEAYEEAILLGADEEQANERAHDCAAVDMTCAGNGGEYLLSWEWGIAAENPTREERLALFGGGAQ